LDKTAKAPGFESDWNVFYQGAKKSTWGGSHSVAAELDPKVRFTSLPDGVEVSFRADPTSGAVKCPLITRDQIGKFPLTGEGIENHDGSPITVDKDILGRTRSRANPAAGPVEPLADGLNVVHLVVGPTVRPFTALSPAH
jgi:hypothetical protein